ncbi:PadR family transcriptional regulator [Psychrobacillus sp. NPDC096426]|uniref:PadR family transcriptional regulator n=1 Tax=Psychrobacillus sp. NPDC096426 TaxID=3364491 RepID=UPI00382422DB
MAENEVSADLIRGNIDTIILRVLKSGDNYGYEIMKAISEGSSGEYILKEPTLYSSLKRLEKADLVKAYWGDQSQGGRRKYYTLTDEGNIVLAENLLAWNRAKELIDRLVQDRSENDE